MRTPTPAVLEALGPLLAEKAAEMQLAVAAAVEVGFGRIVVSEGEAPNLSVDPVQRG